MKAISKILISTVLVAGFATTAVAGELVQDEGRTYDEIASCLKKFDLYEGEEFQKNPENNNRIQFRKGLFRNSAFHRSKQAEIDDCWKKSK